MFAILLRRAAIRGLFEQNPAIATTSLKALLRRNPTVLILVRCVTNNILYAIWVIL
jgi:hypothetical protein